MMKRAVDTGITECCCPKCNSVRGIVKFIVDPDLSCASGLEVSHKTSTINIKDIMTLDCSTEPTDLVGKLQCPRLVKPIESKNYVVGH
jgi:hypothetical protein